VRPVVADRRGRDEHAGARVGGPQPGDEVASPELARRAQPLLGRGAPALGDVLAGEVHDPVAAGQRGRRRRLVLRLPPDRLDAEHGARALGVAGEDRHVVAAFPQRVDDPAPDPPRGSRDRHAHMAGTVAAQPWIARNSAVSPSA
jgi:hypothetical protein